MNRLIPSNLFLPTTIVMLLLFVFGTTLTAQPAANDLADRLEEVYQDRISGISQMEVTTRMQGGMFPEMESVTRFEKVQRGGREQLVQVAADNTSSNLFEGMFDDALPQLVRNASSITMDQRDGEEVYRIQVDDSELLQQMGEESMIDEEMEGEFNLDSVTIWLDPDELVTRHLTFQQTGDGGEEITVQIGFFDYQTHSGLPVSHRMSFNVEGIDQFISDEEMQQARAAMQQMEEQLAQMPEAQRQMIEEQMRSQMEQFEAVMEGGEMGTAEMEVIDIVIE